MGEPREVEGWALCVPWGMRTVVLRPDLSKEEAESLFFTHINLEHMDDLEKAGLEYPGCSIADGFWDRCNEQGWSVQRVSIVPKAQREQEREAMSRIDQDCRYMLKHQNFPVWKRMSEYEQGFHIACGLLEKAMLKRQEEAKA